MRILLFSENGGVGKTSLAAKGVKLAELNYRTLVVSIDPAQSLADAFDLDSDFFHARTLDSLPIDDRLSIQELNIQKEIKRHCQEISSYVSSVLRTTGISGVEAEENGILPAMEELRAMMCINQCGASSATTLSCSMPRPPQNPCASSACRQHLTGT